MYEGPPKLVVFGGNGFVGSRVCEEALKTGLAVTSINRSGAPRVSADWTTNVQWLQVRATLPLPVLHSCVMGASCRTLTCLQTLQSLLHFDQNCLENS